MFSMRLFKKCFIKVITGVIVLGFVCAKPAHSVDKKFIIGVLASRGETFCLQEWNATAQYLTAQIPDTEFSILPLNYDKIISAVINEEVDFLIVNPSIYVDLEVKYGVERLATLVRVRPESHFGYYGAVIFTQRNSTIKNIADLKGKTFAAVHQKSFGGWQMALRELKHESFSTQKLKKLVFEGDADRVVYAVLSGEVDAGTVRTGVIESMVREGKIDKDRIQVLNENVSLPNDFLPASETANNLLVSSELYPEWPFAKIKSTSISLSERVLMELLAIEEDFLPARLGHYRGWTVPVNYQSVHACLKELNVAPYEDFGKISLVEVFEKFSYAIVVFVTLFIFVILVTIRLFWLNKRFFYAEKNLKREINERKQLEKGYIEQETRLRSVLNAIPHAVVGIEEGKIIFANESVKDIFGWHQEELFFKEVEVLFPDEESYASVMEAIDTVFEVENFHSMEIKCVHRQGMVYDCLLSMGKAVREGAKNKKRVIAVFQNVTEERRLQEMIRDQKELFNNLLANISHYVFWKDRNSVFLGCNHNFARVAGKDSPDDIIGKTDYDMPWSKEESEGYRADDREVMESGCPVLNKEETQAQVDGREKVILTSKVPLRDKEGNVIGLIGMFADITDIRQADEKIRTQNKFLEDVINSLGHPFYVIDANDWSVVMANAEARRQGYQHDEKCYNMIHDLSSPCSSTGAACPLDLIKESKKPVFLEHVIKDKNGQTKHIEIHGYPVFDKEGEVIQMIEYTLDVTERKIAEEGLRHNQDKLRLINEELRNNEKALKIMIANLENTQSSLKSAQSQLVQSEKMASIGQLAAGIAHEVNNPAGFINSNLAALDHYLEDIKSIFQIYDQLKEVAEKKNIDEVIEVIDRAVDLEQELDINYIFEDLINLIKESKEGIDRIKGIVGDLKTFSRTSGEAMSMADITEIMDGVINIVWNELKYKVELIKNYENLPKILCNAQQLGQVFMNLLINAGQAIAEKGQIYITTHKEGSIAIIEIRDTGSGISEENKKKIFDPFFTTKEVGHGTGLGLSISYDIIRKHNGTIEVVTEEGVGTTFIIKLPLDKV